MKKLFFLKICIGILAVMLCFSCERASDRVRNQTVDRLKEEYACTFSLEGLYVFAVDDAYVVAIPKSGGKIESAAHFSADRSAIQTENLKLIEDGSFEQYKGVSEEALKDALGAFHADVASGFFAPAYVTDNAYLWVFYIDGETVGVIEKYDIISGEKVERF